MVVGKRLVKVGSQTVGFLSSVRVVALAKTNIMVERGGTLNII